MTGPAERPSTQKGRVWGWLSGLGIGAVPWLVAGIISTFLPEPEATFPWVLLGALVAMLGWIAYGSIRIPGFRKGALAGSALMIALFAGLYLFALWFQP